MAFTIVQIFLALLLAAHVCMCTKQDQSGMDVGVVRYTGNLNKPNFLSDVSDLDEEGTKRERSITYTYKIDITDTINTLRSNVGASDMNYLTKSNSAEDDAANWTSHCDYDADIYASTTEPAYVVIFYTVNSPDYISSLSTIFNRSNFYYALRSVELRAVGAAYSYCSNAIIGGQDYTFYYIGAYFFTYTSNFSSKVQQYTLGEACTTCRSDSYWCYQGGLCKDDCSASDSNCYCNSYCLNCATTNSATCRCQCLDGWIGSRCNSSNGTVTTPSCITTPRVSFAWSTKGSGLTTTIPHTRTTTNASTTTNSGNNVVPIGKPMTQLSLYATLAALCLRLYI